MADGYPGNEWFRSCRVLAFLASAFLSLTVCLSAIYPITSRADGTDLSLEEQRVLYVRATRALAQGDRARFKAIRADLQDYPLLPYLDYADLSSRIRHANDNELDLFFEKYPDIDAERWLRQRWLETLASRKRWSDFIKYYDVHLKSVDLACYYAYAQYNEGDRAEGIARGQSLWQKGKSQPEACDPMFEQLIEDGHIDDALAWKRYVAAVLNHEYGLARYITRFFSRENTRAKADLYLRVDRDPRLITEYEKFSDGTVEESQIISHGITHLARIDSQLALKVWNRYNQSHRFGPEDEQSIISTLIRELYVQGHPESADNYLFLVQDKLSDDLVSWRLREFIKNADWSELIAWSSRLAPEHQAASRVKYWQARALELSGNPSPEVTTTIYNELSGERSFYGFLASEWLKRPYEMQHQPVLVSETELQQLADSPAFQRIRELYYHQDLLWAQREWNRSLEDKDAHEWVIAAKLAESWGWYNQAIMSMIQANYWNDIDVRFPMPYADEFLTQSKATSIPVNLLLALSRQESAFNEKVTSPAGAKGLMQLMPATARETAHKLNIQYTGAGDLEKADKNILIGSRYYKLMLERFNNNRILATAAYNAGPQRVVTWRKQSDGKLPFDAWIEVIPFPETRNYVQNVLAFSIIYAHHMGLEVSILSADEKNTLL